MTHLSSVDDEDDNDDEDPGFVGVCCVFVIIGGLIGGGIFLVYYASELKNKEDWQGRRHTYPNAVIGGFLLFFGCCMATAVCVRIKRKRADRRALRALQASTPLPAPCTDDGATRLA